MGKVGRAAFDLSSREPLCSTRSSGEGGELSRTAPTSIGCSALRSDVCGLALSLSLWESLVLEGRGSHKVGVFPPTTC